MSNENKICLDCNHHIKQDANFCEQCGANQKNLRKDFLKTMNIIRSLTSVSKTDFAVLRGVASETSVWKDEFVKSFYDILFSKEETASVFKDGERAKRETTLGNWYLDLFKIEDDDLFWDIQVRIAFYHVRRKVYNEFMIAIGNKFEELFLIKVVEALGPKKGVEVACAFNRVLDTVVGITVALYDKIIQEAIDVSPEQANKLIDNYINSIEQNYLDGLTASKK